jgi:hypothetical protein
MCARAGQLARYQMWMLKRTRVRVSLPDDPKRSTQRFDKRSLLLHIVEVLACRSVGLAGPKWDDDPSSAPIANTTFRSIPVSEALLGEWRRRARSPTTWRTPSTPTRPPRRWNVRVVATIHPPIVARNESDCWRRLTQRFALACLLYATHGSTSWTNATGWLTYSMAECD